MCRRVPCPGWAPSIFKKDSDDAFPKPYIKLRRGSSSGGANNQKTAKKWQRTKWADRYRRKNIARNGSHAP